jgi:hypothetical protein
VKSEGAEAAWRALPEPDQLLVLARAARRLLPPGTRWTGRLALVGAGIGIAEELAGGTDVSRADADLALREIRMEALPDSSREKALLALAEAVAVLVPEAPAARGDGTARLPHALLPTLLAAVLPSLHEAADAAVRRDIRDMRAGNGLGPLWTDSEQLRISAAVDPGSRPAGTAAPRDHARQPPRPMSERDPGDVRASWRAFTRTSAQKRALLAQSPDQHVTPPRELALLRGLVEHLQG